MPDPNRSLRPPLLILLAAVAGCAQPGSSADPEDWPVFGGNTDNTHFTTLSQSSISPQPL